MVRTAQRLADAGFYEWKLIQMVGSEASISDNKVHLGLDTGISSRVLDQVIREKGEKPCGRIVACLVCHVQSVSRHIGSDLAFYKPLLWIEGADRPAKRKVIMLSMMIESESWSPETGSLRFNMAENNPSLSLGDARRRASTSAQNCRIQALFSSNRLFALHMRFVYQDGRLDRRWHSANMAPKRCAKG